MNIVVGIIAPVLVPEGGNLVMFAVQAGLNFGAGLLIMLYGVRLLINQIIPAFQGIAEKSSLEPNQLLMYRSYSIIVRMP